MGLQVAVHLGHMPWALTKEEEEESKFIHIMELKSASYTFF
jgi:hypothetical protein